MSLLYIIDAYNIIHHPAFKAQSRHIPRTEHGSNLEDSRRSLLECIRYRKLSGSSRNTVIIVFDGSPGRYGDSLSADFREFSVIFSREVSADKKICAIVENKCDPKTTVVVSDDNEIRFFCRASGTEVKHVEEFLGVGRAGPKRGRETIINDELNYTQKERINRELKDKWLK